MKTYAIVGNKYEGLYTKPWSEVKAYTQTKPAPKFKGFTTKAEAQTWFDNQVSAKTTRHANIVLPTMAHFKQIPTNIIFLLMAVAVILVMSLVGMSKLPIKPAGQLPFIMVLTSMSPYILIVARTGVAPTMKWKCWH